MSISGISPYDGNLIGNPAQNTAMAPNGLDASVRKPASTVSSLSAQDAAALMLSIPNPDVTVSLESLSSTAGNLQAADNSNILQNSPTVAQAVLNPVSSPTLEAMSPTLINLQGAIDTGVLQANQALAQSLLGFTNPEPPLEALLFTPSNLQAIQRVNATEHNPVRSQYFFTAYFKIMNMPISSPTVDITA